MSKEKKVASQYYTKYIVVSHDDRNNKPSYKLNKLEGDQETQDYNWDEGNKLVTYEFVQNRMSKLLGRVLTIMDASIIDKSQNKAVKDIIKTIFVDEYIELTDMLYDKNSLISQCENVSDEDITDITTDEALGIK